MPFSSRYQRGIETRAGSAVEGEGHRWEAAQRQSPEVSSVGSSHAELFFDSSVDAASIRRRVLELDSAKVGF